MESVEEETLPEAVVEITFMTLNSNWKTAGNFQSYKDLYFLQERQFTHQSESDMEGHRLLLFAQFISLTHPGLSQKIALVYLKRQHVFVRDLLSNIKSRQSNITSAKVSCF